VLAEPGGDRKSEKVKDQGSNTTLKETGRGCAMSNQLTFAVRAAIAADVPRLTCVFTLARVNCPGRSCTHKRDAAGGIAPRSMSAIGGKADMG
jgi:hypothetical protein